MKIKIAYLPAEEPQATEVLAALIRRHPGAEVHKTERYPPFKHIYLTTRKSSGCCNSNENA